MNENDQVANNANVQNKASPIKLTYDISTPIDQKRALSQLNGNNQLYLSMLSRFESTSLNECLSNVKLGLDTDDQQSLQDGFHTLKGASGYIGAGRIHFACFYIEDAYQEKNRQQLEFSYALLVEISIEFKRYTKKFIAEFRNEQYEENKSSFKIEVASGFALQLDPKSDRYYCLNKEQTLEQRIAIADQIDLTKPFMACQMKKEAARNQPLNSIGSNSSVSPQSKRSNNSKNCEQSGQCGQSKSISEPVGNSNEPVINIQEESKVQQQNESAAVGVEPNNKPSVRMPYVSVLIDRVNNPQNDKSERIPSLERNQQKFQNKPLVPVKPPPLDLSKVLDHQQEAIRNAHDDDSEVWQSQKADKQPQLEDKKQKSNPKKDQDKIIRIISNPSLPNDNSGSRKFPSIDKPGSRPRQVNNQQRSTRAQFEATNEKQGLNDFCTCQQTCHIF